MTPSSLVGWIVIGVGTLILGSAIFVGVMVALVFVGGPSGEAVCGERVLDPAPAADRSFDPRWDGFDRFLNTGVPDSLDLEEDVVTARAREFLGVEQGVDVIRDVVICFSGPTQTGALGEAEIRGRVDIPVLPDVSASVRGRLDLTGAHPVLELTEITVGSLPGFITGGLDGEIESAINAALADVQLQHRYHLEFRDGFARVNGQPR